MAGCAVLRRGHREFGPLICLMLDEAWKHKCSRPPGTAACSICVKLGRADRSLSGPVHCSPLLMGPDQWAALCRETTEIKTDCFRSVQNGKEAYSVTFKLAAPSILTIIDFDIIGTCYMLFLFF